MRLIGENEPCLIVADHAAPEAALKAGADAVIDADPDACASAGLLLGVRVDADEEPLAERADFLVLGDGEITNRPFIEICARLGLPTLMGTGGSTLKEVSRAVGWFQLAFRGGEVAYPQGPRLGLAGGGKLILMHGTLVDDPGDGDLNLRAMGRMHDQSFMPVGIEDRSNGSTAGALAVAAGACAIVRRLDEHFEPMARAVRRAETMLGAGNKGPVQGEEAAGASLRRRVVAAGDLEKGRELTHTDLTLQPPAPEEGHFAPHHAEKILGRKLRRAVGKGEPITEEDLGGGIPEPAPWFSRRPPKQRP